METTEIIVKGKAIANPNRDKALDIIKVSTKTEGKCHGINFIKILHMIVLF